MTEQLNTLFDHITPAELDLLLADDFNRESLDPDSMARIKGKVHTTLKTRRRKRHTAHWAVAAVLAVAIGIGGAVSVWEDGPVSPTDDPTPAVSPYNVFSDPNVLWGEEEENPDVLGFLGSNVIWMGPELQKNIAAAGEENLIAFIIDPAWGGWNFHVHYPVDMDRLIISDTLDPNGELTELVKRNIAGEDPDGYARQISEYMLRFQIDSVNPNEIPLNIITDGIYRQLIIDYGYTDGVPAAESEKLKGEAVLIARQREKYQKCEAEYKRYVAARDLFDYSWTAQQVEGLREEMIGLGFIPVYSMDEIHGVEYVFPYTNQDYRYGKYVGNAVRSPISVFQEMALTFVGTAEQIAEFEQTVKENGGCYYMWSSAKERQGTPIPS